MSFRNFRLAALASSILLAGLAQAQVLGTISASPTSVKVGETVTITANIDVVGGNYCGFVVAFGDGTFKDAVSDVSNAVPLVVTRTYDKPGSYHVTLGGKNVQNHPNCGGPERAVDITVTGAVKAAAAAPTALKASEVCGSGWKLSGKLNTKTGTFTCVAKAGTALPATKPACSGNLSYFENAKKGQYGCKP
jgi:PKD domain